MYLMVDTLVTGKSEWRGESRINALDRKERAELIRLETSRLETIERAANSALASPISGGADQTCPRCWGHLRGELIQPRLWVYAVPVLCQAYQSSHPSDSIYSLYLIPNFPKKLTLCRLYCLTGKRLRPTFIRWTLSRGNLFPRYLCWSISIIKPFILHLWGRR